MSRNVPHDGNYKPPWRIVPCDTFAGRFAIVDSEDQAVAFGLSAGMAEGWKEELETTGFIDHDP